MKLRLRGISVQLPGMAKPLFAIDQFDVASGAKVLIQGPSGRGKTTFLHLIAGLLDPITGSVELNEQNLKHFSEKERSRLRRDRIGLIFQKLNLISHLTARENVALARGDSDAVSNALKLVRLSEQADVLAQNLSVGQQQRVAVARILTRRPELVLADEPTSSLDDDNTDVVMSSLFSLPPSTTVIVVSHDHRIAKRFDKVYGFSELVKK